VPAVKDYQAAVEKLRAEAAESRLICDLATDPAKREMFDRLALHLTSLADQVELALIEAAKPKRA
jgi:DNA-binding TFAR19-related protein (PDSD5 family)